jgi:hypothetical protein
MNATSLYFRAIRGPIMLITLGTLLAIDFAGSFSFWRTWPAILVVIGILILLERVTASPALPVQPAPPGDRI